MRPSTNTISRGFTLIEVLIYVAFIATGFAAAAFIVQAGFQARSIASAQIRLLDAERIVEWTIEDRIEEAGDVLAPESGTGTTLQISSPVTGENPVTFSLSSGTLMMQLGESSAEALTPDNVTATSFSVTRLNGSPPAVQVVIAYEITAIDTTLSDTSTVTYTLRYEE